MSLQRLAVVLAMLAGCGRRGATPEVVSYELAYGECLGVCVFTLTTDDDLVTLTADDTERSEPWVRTTAFTEAGRTAWDDGREGLLDLPEVSGCPGCDDGGAVELTIYLADLDETRSHRWEQGAPPDGAEAFDAVADEALQALARCEPSDLVQPLADCAPL